MQTIDIGHPRAKRATISYEGPFESAWKMVIIIEIDMNLNPQDSDFDFDVLKGVIDAAKIYVDAHNRQVEDFRIIQAS